MRQQGKHVRREPPPRPDLPPRWTLVQVLLVAVFVVGALTVLAWGILSFK